ncbi:hypothetical protein WA026_010772 [Henosepilachna vigintioctopunctata]|uniref:F-box domain-containing protein n=1 Tax=Henosepilachna vigintioctopunctata TaxID=420089 RepID=A0AAW1UZ76_9CUCU
MFKTSELEQFANKVLEFTTRYNSHNHVSYAPCNLTGRYTKYPSYGDSPETYTLRGYGHWWRLSEANYQKPYMVNDTDALGAEDFITVQFSQAVAPSKIFIYETYTPGSVVRIWGRRMKEKWTRLWEGPPQKCPPEARKFQPKLINVSCFVDTIKLELNCSELNHYTCFDAILLAGLTASGSHFQRKCLEAFGIPKMAVVTTICDGSESYSSTSKRKKKKDYFKILPHELMIHIFQFLDMRSLLRCSRVSKQWNEISRDSLLYQNISLKKYWYTVDSRALEFFQNRCQNLKKLDLSWCGNDDPSFSRKFYQFFTSVCKSLTHLSLGNANYFNGSHLAALSKCPNLVELRLRNVSIIDLEYCHIETLVTKLKKLVTLDLYSTNITSDLLLPLLKSNPNLKYLNLDFCDDIENLDDVIEVVVQHNKKLTGWSSWKARRLSSKGVSLLGHCYNLEDLDLGWGLHMSPPEHALEKIAMGCKGLRRLILSGWRPLIDSMLLPIIENCKQLEQLDLLSIKGISKEFVEKIFKELPSLKLLELSFCDSIPFEKVFIIAFKQLFIIICFFFKYFSFRSKSGEDFIHMC